MAPFFVIIVCTHLFNCFYVLPGVIIFPITNIKYCNNIYRKCEYYKANGNLINNTINVDMKKFIHEYNLISTYQYNKNETCTNMNYHAYTSHEDMQIFLVCY